MYKKVIVALVIGMMATTAMAKKRSRRVAEDAGTQNQVQTQVKRKEAKPRVQTQIKKQEAILETKVQEVPVQENEKSVLWRKGKGTVVQLKGQASEDSASCKTFQIHLGKSLNYNIQCIGQEMNESVELASGPGHTVTQKGSHITITKYNYLMKKTRISRLKESTLKVPFVEKIIHIKKSDDGTMAFYFESFKEDEFGRIVQDGFIQAHTLTNKPMNISAN